MSRDGSMNALADEVHKQEVSRTSHLSLHVAMQGELANY